MLNKTAEGLRKMARKLPRVMASMALNWLYLDSISGKFGYIIEPRKKKAFWFVVHQPFA